MNRLLPLFLTLTLMLSAMRLKAQEKEYLYEIGGGLGSSWGYGDVNASKAIYSPSVSFSLVWRYNLNLRWVLATEFESDGISGNTRDFDYAFPGGDYDFSCRYWQIAIRPEINFWNYGLGSDYREKKRYTPFLTAGLTAGVVSGGGDGAQFAWGIPIGAGYKLKMSKRWNAQIACLFTKTFSDNLDGIADPEGIKTSSVIGDDWQATLRLSVTFDFKERCIECHNQKNMAR